MPVDYNYINASNVTSMQELIHYANVQSDGWFGVGILLSFFVILAVSFLGKGDDKQGFAIAGFLTCILAILMRLINLIPDLVLIIAVIIFFASVFLMRSD